MNSTLVNSLRSTMLALGLSVLATSSIAQEAEREWKLSGWIDLYHLSDFNRTPSTQDLALRQFDIKHNRPAFANAQLNLDRSASRALPLSLGLSLAVGDNVDVANLLEPGGPKKYKNVHRLVVGGQVGKVALEFGKFAAVAGYEGWASADNDNYSRSLLFLLAQPLYHTGLKASFPVGGFSGTLYAVTGWNEVEDSNGEKTLGASLGWSAGKLSTGLNYLRGTEGRSAPAPHNSASTGGIGFASLGKRDTELFDVVATYLVNDKLKLGLNVDYASAKGKSGASGGKWYGFAVYVKAGVAKNLSAGARYEQFKDANGLRLGTVAKLDEATLNLDYVLGNGNLLRAEYRHDNADKALYPSNGAPKKTRDTLSVSYVIKF